MSARSKARKRAIDILYSADVRRSDIQTVLNAEAVRAAGEPERQASWVYARDIVDGILDHKAEIDEQIETYSQGWSLARMPTLDRAILRIGVWEILFNEEVPSGVAINEAVESAKTLSTDESPGFVNGLLGKISDAAGAS